MQFVKDLARNLLVLFVIGVVLFVMFPDMMKQAFQLYGALFGPLALIFLVVIALPRKSRKKRR